MQFGIKGKHQQNHHVKANVVDGGKSTFHYGSSTTGKTDQETQSPVLKIFTDMLAREKPFQGYRDPEKAALLRAEHKRDRDSKRDDRRGDDRKDDGKTTAREESDERRPRASKKNKKPRAAKNRSISNPKSKEKKKLKAKLSCHCPKTPTPPLPPPPVCDDACCQYDAECQQSSSKEDVALEQNLEARVTTTPPRENAADSDSERIYEQRERVRERNFKKKMDDTCSCASCVLKKMCRNDCICCCCVAFVFILCLFLAFMLVCKSIPCLRSKFNVFGPVDDLESDRLKRKIDVPTDMQWDGLGKKHGRSNKWEYDRLPGHPVPHSMESVVYGDVNLSHESDLMKVIDSEKLNEIQGNQQLREFYKKLVTTDAEIRKLKKDYLFNVDTSNRIPYPDRAKRSLAILKSPFRMFYPKTKKIKEITIEGKATEAAEVTEPNTGHEAKKKETKDARVKRLDTNEDGLLIEKKKVSIHFVPKGRRTFKGSHAPKEINSYEKQGKNPFHQNTQRLDELLDKFLDKNDMDTLGEPYSRSMMTVNKFKHKNINNKEINGKPTKKLMTENDKKGEFEVNFNDAKNKMLKNAFRNHYNNKHRKIQRLPVDDNLKLLDDQIEKSKMLTEHYNKNNQQSDSDAVQEFLKSHGGATNAKAKAKGRMTTDGTKKGNDLIKGNTETTTHNYNLLMSISTMLYKDIVNPLPTKEPDDGQKAKDRALLVGRRLMQIETEEDDEEESVMPASEPADERRKRRDYGMNPNNVINPNWKGPMPLYPDELNTLNKPNPVIATSNENPGSQSLLFSDPKNRKLYGYKFRGMAKSKEPKHLADTDYIEDYFRNKYNKEEMAQGYSDYGVLNDKKFKTERVDQRFRNYEKVNTDKTPGMNLMGVEKNSPWNSPDEGFKLQLFPPSSRFDGVMKTLQEHIKFTGTPDTETTTDTETTLDAFFAGHPFESTKGSTEVLDVKDILEDERPMEFEFRNVKKRSLKSVDDYQNDDPSDAIESLMNFRGIFNGLQKKFSTKLGSAQDYAIKVASDYIHDGIYKRDVDSVDVDVVNDSIADDNITVSDNITENDNVIDVYNRTDAVKLVANDSDNSTAQRIETGVQIVTGNVHNDTGTTLSDFFMKLAHWFSLLDTLDLSANKSQQANFSATNNASETTKDQPKFELNFPLYDADMIENIGHRSRVLLAVNESEPVDDTTPDGEGKKVTETKGVEVVGTEIDTTTTTNLETVNANDNKTKTIVKRNANGNLFWDDVYNDEYGTDTDNIDESDASKSVQSYASKTAEKRNPKEWFKKIVHRLKAGAAKCAPAHRPAVKEKGHRKRSKKGKSKLKKPKQPIKDSKIVATRRFYRKTDEYPTEEKKTDFTALTAKMKKICQKAAKDISLSKKLAVREESKEGQVASNLMQQLIGLMSDLVDYQVHEKTCRKLPMDLQNFLEWLTNPEATVMTYHGKDVMHTQRNKGMPHEEPIEEIHALEAMPPEEMEPEPKADCMSVLAAVRDLLNQYDSLSDEDKSKMSGVKEYLEAQIEYLQKYITNDFSLLNTDISRYKRHAVVSDPNYRLDKVKSVYVTFKKYMSKQNEHGGNITKNLHASNKKSTTSKLMTISLAIEKVPDVVKLEKKMKKVKFEKKMVTKRNLKDVYYKALEEAKLMTAATVDAKSTTALSKTTDY